MTTRSSDRLISVIVTVYNAAPYLGEAIDSVLAQTYRPFELIVLDDGSTDGSGDVAQQYGSAVRFTRQERQGLGAARNAAVALADGSYLAFLDADDRFLPEKLERQMEVLDADAGTDMVFGHVTEFVSPDIDESAAARLREPVHDVAWRMPNLMLVRRGSFDEVGPFSTTLRVGIGVDWYARARDEGLKEAVPPFVVLERRLHASNNGIRERESRQQYLHVIKQSLDRRRRLGGAANSEPPSRGA
ncbi:MAG TPA: glycosyltransferase family A protein [Gaiellaceae bacterium]|nr:glycosyltransferase family A protein [Gaiellaceae bacterium]